MSLLENTKKSIYGLQVLIAEDFSSKDEIRQKVIDKIQRLQLLDDDAEAIESVSLLKRFLQDCKKQNDKLNKLENKELIYEDALRNTEAKHQREFILKKLQEIDTDKTKFL
jgi:hypothetical protein